MLTPEQIDVICDEFEEAWLDQAQPDLAEYLSRFKDPEEKKQLIEPLLPLDVEYRRKAGQSPQPSDYLWLNPFATIEPELFAIPEILKPSNASPDGSRFIGPYKLLQRLGQGGMGEVWMAEQYKPIRRRVAIKLIKSGLVHDQLLARFEAERQALALMDHSNIARVLDAGTSSEGQPYFVMELVMGIPFTEYCDQQKLSIDERLDLFIPVCSAVQHAHQKGIIHRDLKPNNILVSHYDGKPTPKVIDFGLAKALLHQHKLTDKTLFTEFGQVLGTVQYMSPEQAELNQIDVDTRTDIYSLGVILYEILTGSTPLERELFQHEALMKVLEVIREKEPPRPSVRISSTNEQAVRGISLQRQIDISKLKSTLQGELDWIVMKAIDKNRNRRYETASSLADDIHRYRHNEVVMARPPSKIYLWSKALRKHSLAFQILGLVFGLLILGLGLTYSQMRRAIYAETIANGQKEAANQARIQANQARDGAVELNRKLQTALEQVDEKTAKDLFERGNQLSEVGQADSAKELIYSALRILPKNSSQKEMYTIRLASIESQSGRMLLRKPTLGTDTTVSESGRVFASVSLDRSAIGLYLTKDGKLLCTLRLKDTKAVSISKDDTIALVWSHSSHSTKPEDVAIENSEGAVIGNGEAPNQVPQDRPRGLVGHRYQIHSGQQIGAPIQLKSSYRSYVLSDDCRTLAYVDEEKSEIIVHRLDDKEAVKSIPIVDRDLSLFFGAKGDQLLSISSLGVATLFDVRTTNIVEGPVQLEDLYTTAVSAFDFDWTGVLPICESVVGEANEEEITHDKPFRCWVAKDSLVISAILRSASGSRERYNLNNLRSSAGRKITLFEQLCPKQPPKLFRSSSAKLTAVSKDGSVLAILESSDTSQDRAITSVTDTSSYSFNLTEKLAVPRARLLLRQLNDTVYDDIEILVPDRVIAAVFSPDSSRLAVSFMDRGINFVHVFDLTGAPVSLPIRHNSIVRDMIFSDDSQMIYGISETGILTACKVDDYSVVKSTKPEEEKIDFMAVSPDSSTLALGYRRQGLRIYDLKTLKLLSQDQRSVLGIAYSPDGKKIATSGPNSVMIWDATSLELTHELEYKGPWVSSVSFDATGQCLAAASPNQDVCLWRIADSSAEQQKTLQFRAKYLLFTAMKAIAISLDMKGNIRFWDVELEQSQGNAVDPPLKSPSTVVDAEISRNRLRLAVQFSGQIHVYDFTTASWLPSMIQIPNRGYDSFDVSPDGKLLAYITNPDQIQIFDIDSGRRIRNLQLAETQAAACCIRFIDSEGAIAVGRKDGSCLIFGSEIKNQAEAMEIIGAVSSEIDYQRIAL